MKGLFRRSLTVISILLLLPYNQMWGCGPILDADQMRFVLFNPRLSGDDGLASFRYTPHFLSGGVNNSMETDRARNCREWVAVMRHAATAREVDAVVYGMTPDDFLYAVKTGDWHKVPHNRMADWLRQKQHRAWLNYLAFARKVEFELGGSNDPWEQGGGSNHFDQYDTLIAAALRQCVQLPAGALRERYAFQAVKLLYYYNDNNDIQQAANGRVKHSDTKLIRVYERYLKGRNSIVADWALLYYGLSFSDRRRRAQYLLQAFDRTEEKKEFVYNYLPVKDVQLLERTGLPAHAMAVLHAYKAIKSPGRALNEIKIVVQYEPDSKYLPLLLGREINKIEDWILTPEKMGFYPQLRSAMFYKNNRQYGDDRYEDFQAANIAKDKQYLLQVNAFLAAQPGASRRYASLLQLARMHLYHVVGSHDSAAQLLAGLQPPAERQYRVQYDIERALALIYTQDVTAAATTAQLEQVFESLERNGVRTDTADRQDYEVLRSDSRDLISPLYLLLSQQLHRRGSRVAAGLVAQASKCAVNDNLGGWYYESEKENKDRYYHIAWFDKYGTPADIDQLLAFRHKRHKTAFEKRITPARWASDNFYKDLKGTMLVRQGRWEEALEVLQQIPETFWETSYEFSEYLRRSSVTNMGTLIPYTIGREGNYSHAGKRQIVQEIVGLRAALRGPLTDSARASVCFLLGNSYFNVSYHGKDWMVFSYGKSCREEDDTYGHDYKWANYSFEPNASRYGRTYYECGAAMRMYQQALGARPRNKELAACCLLMLSECEKLKGRYLGAKAAGRRRTWSHDWFDRSKYYSNYLALMRSRYGSTMVYNNSITECPDVAAYYAAHKR